MTGLYVGLGIFCMGIAIIVAVHWFGANDTLVEQTIANAMLLVLGAGVTALGAVVMVVSFIAVALH